MSEKSCCRPISIIFVLLLGVTMLYIVLRQDVLCGIGVILTLILGILVIYGILTSPKTPMTGEEYMRSRPITLREDLNVSREDAEKKADEEWKEESEADEDLAIAYEAMNDWEDFEDL